MALEREEFIERMRQPLSPLEKELVTISEGGLGKLRQSSNKPSVREISQTEEIITPNNMRGLPPSAKNVSRSPLINIANAPKTQGELDSIMAENVYSAPNKARAGLQGLTLGGADEIEALARSTFGDESYEEAKRNIGLSYDQYVKDNPGEALSLELAGGFAPFIIASLMSGGTATPFLAARAATGTGKAALSKLGNFANKAISLLPKGKTFASQLARQGILGGTIGATEGALSAKTGERGSGAVQGGIFGSGFGMGLSSAGKLLGAGYDKLVRKYFNPSEVATAPMSKPKKIAVEKLAKTMDEADLEPKDLLRLTKEMNQYIDDPKKYAKILDAHPLLIKEAKRIILTPSNPGEKLKENLIEGRIKQSKDDLINITRKNISNVNRARLVKDLENELDTEMGNFYNKAFDWKNPNGNKAAQQGLIDDPRIMSMLQRSDWQEAYKLAKKNNDELIQLAEDTGKTPPRKMKEMGELPDVFTLNEVKKAFDDFIDLGVKEGNIAKNAKRTFTMKKNEFLNIIDEITQIDGVSPYKLARGKFQSVKEVEEAIDNGKKFRSKDPEEVITDLEDLSERARMGYVASAAREITDIASKSSAKSGDFASKVLENRDLVAKIRALFPNNSDDDAVEFFIKQLSVNQKMYENAQKALPRSDTAENLESISKFDKVTDILNKLGNPMDPRNIVSLAINFLSGPKQSKEMLEELSNLLDTNDPTAIATIAAVLEKQVKRNAELGAGKQNLLDASTIYAQGKVGDDDGMTYFRPYDQEMQESVNPDQELDVYTETIAGTNKSKGKRAYKKGGAVDLETLLEEVEEMGI
jgi:hypothetical protein